MSVPAGIKNIIFDLGGVLLNLDYGLTNQALKEIGLSEIDRIYTQKLQPELFDDYETGRISSEKFRAELSKLIGRKIDNDQLDKAWNAMLLDFPEERIRLLEKLKKRYRLFLLSNTNDIHITAYSSYLKRIFGFPDLSHIFEKEYYSYRVGKRKPDKEIFELVLSENDLNPSETFFIDDSIQHVQGAQRVGIHAYHLQKPETILEVFSGSWTNNS
jgi:HAD superfamily hydrolase (TIGR01509 family)